MMVDHHIDTPMAGGPVVIGYVPSDVTALALIVIVGGDENVTKIASQVADPDMGIVDRYAGQLWILDVILGNEVSIDMFAGPKKIGETVGVERGIPPLRVLERFGDRLRGHKPPQDRVLPAGAALEGAVGEDQHQGLLGGVVGHEERVHGARRRSGGESAADRRSCDAPHARAQPPQGSAGWP
jgi:hypothetical protein